MARELADAERTFSTAQMSRVTRDYRLGIVVGFLFLANAILWAVRGVETINIVLACIWAVLGLVSLGRLVARRDQLRQERAD